jgi:hypothetical protein
VNLTATTDAQGNFVFDRAPSGDFDLYLFPGMYLPFSHQTAVRVQPGETLTVQIGGTGATVIGKFVLSDASRTISWDRQTRSAMIFTPRKSPPVPPELKGDARKNWINGYWRSPEGIAAARAMRNYPLTVAADGSFTAENVPAGTYDLNAMFSSVPLEENQAPTMSRAPLLGSIRQEIVVPESANNPASEPVDLGVVTVKMK